MQESRHRGTVHWVDSTGALNGKTYAIKLTIQNEVTIIACREVQTDVDPSLGWL